MTGVFYVPLREHGGGTNTELESAHEVNSGEEKSPAAPAGIRTRNLSITDPALLSTTYPGSPNPTKSEWAEYAAVQAQCGNLSGNELTRNSSGNNRSVISAC